MPSFRKLLGLVTAVGACGAVLIGTGGTAEAICQCVVYYYGTASTLSAAYDYAYNGAGDPDHATCTNAGYTYDSTYQVYTAKIRCPA